MFRRVEEGLVKDHPDPHWKDDLKELGYFITEAGLLRKIGQPDERFSFWITNHDRYNENHREAMQKCVRREIEKRMSALGIGKLYLPQLVSTKPANAPHIPIFAPPADVLATKKRVVVFINDDYQDLGVLAYRWLYGEGGFDGGSCIQIAKDLTTRSPDADDSAGGRTPGLVVLNPGSLRYSHRYNSAMTPASWLAMPRKSIAHPRTGFDGVENTVAGHRTVEEHVTSVFDQIVCDDKFVASAAEVYVVAVSRGAGAALDVLEEHWAKYGHRITGLALIDPPAVLHVRRPELTSFLKHRARAWAKSFAPTHTLVGTPFVPIPAGLEVSGVSEEEQDAQDQQPGSGHPGPGGVDWLETVAHAGVTRQQIHDVIGFNDSGSYLRHVTERGLEDVIVSAGPSMVNLPAAEKDATSSHSAGSEDAQEAPEEAQKTVSKMHHSGRPAQSDAVCPTFSGGEDYVAEMIFPNVKDAVFDFFEEMARHPGDFANPTFTLPPQERAERTDEDVAAQMAALELENPKETKEKAPVKDSANLIRDGSMALDADLLRDAGFDVDALIRATRGKDEAAQEGERKDSAL